MVAPAGGGHRALRGGAASELERAVELQRWRCEVGKAQRQWRSPRREQEREKSKSEAMEWAWRAATARPEDVRQRAREWLRAPSMAATRRLCTARGRPCRPIQIGSNRFRVGEDD
jgi:hypothetical protein